jgi:hypothetical protein
MKNASEKQAEEIQLTEDQKSQGWMLSEECGYRPGAVYLDYSATVTIVVERHRNGWVRYMLINRVGDGNPRYFKTLSKALAN